MPRWRDNPERLAISRGCCWPDCEWPATEPPQVPLCRRHLFKAFHFVSDEIQTNARMTASPRVSRGDGQVYFIRFGNRIKIGFTKNLPGRLADLPHDEVLAVMPGGLADEARCHAAFAHLRETGEWFRPEKDLLDFIADIKT
jgi:hypothetical protein